MGGNVHDLFTAVTLVVSAYVVMLSVYFVTFFTVGTLFVAIATSCHFMMVEAVLAVKFEMTIRADKTWLLILVLLWAWIFVVAFTGATCPAFARMVVPVFVVEATVAEVVKPLKVVHPS